MRFGLLFSSSQLLLTLLLWSTQIGHAANVLRDMLRFPLPKYSFSFQHTEAKFNIADTFSCDDVLVAGNGDAELCKDRIFSYMQRQRHSGDFCPFPPPKPMGLDDLDNFRIMEVSVLKTGTTDRRDKLNMHCWRSNMPPAWNLGDVLDRLTYNVALPLFLPVNPDVQEANRNKLKALDRAEQTRECFVRGSVCHCRKGHNDFSDYWFLPHTNTNFFTFLREATSRYLSFYEYYKMQHDLFLETQHTDTVRFAFFTRAEFHLQNLTTLERYMEYYGNRKSYLFEYGFNLQVHMFSGIMLHTNIINNELNRKEELKQLRTDAEINLCNMFQFVGLFEEIPASIRLYKAVFGIDAVRDGYDGRGKKMNQNLQVVGKPKAEDRYSPRLIATLREYQAEEINLYAVAKRRFEAHYRLLLGHSVEDDNARVDAEELSN